MADVCILPAGDFHRGGELDIDIGSDHSVLIRKYDNTNISRDSAA